MPRPLYLRHPASLEHETGVHPERAERIVTIEAELERRDWLGFEPVLAPLAAREAVEAVHPAAYVDELEAMSARGGGMLDPDTAMSSGSFEAAMRGAGAAVALVDALLDGSAPAGFCGVRPPGHHALPDRAMGFCLLANVAIAARRALDAHGLERVLVLDWDVHHGNGTNDIFHSSDAVLFCSIHQSPLYPGTGTATDVGGGPGQGWTINLPVGAGTGDGVFCSHVEHLVAPVARAWRPQLVLVSAGYDAHWRDPIGGCRLTETGYARMTASVRELASAVEAPVGMVLEGGYDLEALAASVAATLEALVAPADPDPPAVPLDRATVAASGRLARWWPAIAGGRSG